MSELLLLDILHTLNVSVPLKFVKVVLSAILYFSSLCFLMSMKLYVIAECICSVTYFVSHSYIHQIRNISSLPKKKIIRNIISFFSIKLLPLVAWEKNEFKKVQGWSKDLKIKASIAEQQSSFHLNSSEWYWKKSAITNQLKYRGWKKLKSKNEGLPTTTISPYQHLNNNWLGQSIDNGICIIHSLHSHHHSKIIIRKKSYKMHKYFG